MHAGVIRDYEQQRLKRERQADFEMQQALEKEYLKVQTEAAERQNRRVAMRRITPLLAGDQTSGQLR